MEMTTNEIIGQLEALEQAFIERDNATPICLGKAVEELKELQELRDKYKNVSEAYMKVNLAYYNLQIEYNRLKGREEE